jgi:hypothetical protein
MTETSFASLSPALLARKGGAKPAMRPQSSLPGKIDNQTAAAGLEDLGWNDMGNTHGADQKTAAGHDKVVALASNVDAKSAKTPVSTNDDDAPKAAVKSVSKKTSANKSSRRAAFTLRLDADRHLRLRLASTVRGCSAQQFVTEALDKMLDDMPEIETLAAQVQRD